MFYSASSLHLYPHFHISTPWNFNMFNLLSVDIWKSRRLDTFERLPTYVLGRGKHSQNRNLSPVQYDPTCSCFMKRLMTFELDPRCFKKFTLLGYQSEIHCPSPSVIDTILGVVSPAWPTYLHDHDWKWVIGAMVGSLNQRGFKRDSQTPSKRWKIADEEAQGTDQPWKLHVFLRGLQNKGLKRHWLFHATSSCWWTSWLLHGSVTIRSGFGQDTMIGEAHDLPRRAGLVAYL